MGHGDLPGADMRGEQYRSLTTGAQLIELPVTGEFHHERLGPHDPHGRLIDQRQAELVHIAVSPEKPSHRPLGTEPPLQIRRTRPGHTGQTGVIEYHEREKSIGRIDADRFQENVEESYPQTAAVGFLPYIFTAGRRILRIICMLRTVSRHYASPYRRACGKSERRILCNIR